MDFSCKYWLDLCSYIDQFGRRVARMTRSRPEPNRPTAHYRPAPARWIGSPNYDKFGQYNNHYCIDHPPWGAGGGPLKTPWGPPRREGSVLRPDNA